MLGSRKTGLQMLLSQMGIEIDPQEIMAKYNEAKNIMPKLAVFVDQLDGRLKRIEERLGLENGNTGTAVSSTADRSTDNNGA